MVTENSAPQSSKMVYIENGQKPISVIINEQIAMPPPTTSPHMIDRPRSLRPSTFGLYQYYKKVVLAPDRCLLPADILNSSPSRGDGVDVELEKSLRYLGCELIQSASILLRLPQVAAATGQVLYQRYFYAKSFARNDYEHVAMACTYLAAKIEEAARRPREVLNAFHHLKQLNKYARGTGACAELRQRSRLLTFILARLALCRPQPLLLDIGYQVLKQSMIKCERRVLNTLGFCVHVKHPHKLITSFAKALCVVDEEAMMQKAWNYINDGLRTNIFVKFPPETIACACLWLAAKYEKIPLPEKPRPWYELFDATREDLTQISLTLIEMYKRTRPPSWPKIDSSIRSIREQYTAKIALEKAKIAAAEQRRVAVEKENQNAALRALQEKMREQNGKQNGHANARRHSRSPSLSPEEEDRRRRSSKNRREDQFKKKIDSRSLGIRLGNSHRDRTDDRHRDRPRHHDREREKDRYDRDRDDDRDRSRDRVRTESRGRRDREREVMAALGKRSYNRDRSTGRDDDTPPNRRRR